MYNLYIMIMPIIILFGLGAIAGSYLMASVWRIKQLEQGESKSLSALNDYSRCLNCGYRLKWYDLIPIVSWLAICGKCRKCKKSIGFSELFSEIFVGLIFALTFVFWPFGDGLALLNLFRLSIWFSFVLCSMVLFLYDLKWQELPSALLYALIGLGAVFAVTFNFPAAVLSALVLGGIYFILYYLSKGAWVGDGDGYLGFALGLVLGDWRLAFIGLFLANLIGLIFVLPGLLNKKVTPSTQVALGPLLILGFYICFFAQDLIIPVIEF